VSIERGKEWGDTRDRDLRELKKVGLGLGHGGVRRLAVEGGEHVQKDGDKERHWDCARGSVRAARGLMREGRCGGGRLAWREANELMHSRCLTERCLARRHRERTIGT
jgi:hypothetical protein